MKLGEWSIPITDVYIILNGTYVIAFGIEGIYLMRLKVKEESNTGLNTRFVNEESGRTMSLEHVIDQIENGNPNYNKYEKVQNPNGTVYVRSKPDGNQNNNIE